MIQKSVIRFALFLSMTCALSTHTAWADEFTVNLTGGSIVVVEANDQTIDWRTIDAQGATTKVPVNLSQVDRIELTDRPASVQIARVRTLLDRLDDDDFQRREDAQMELSQPSVGRRFKTLVASELRNESLEVRTRVRHILDSFNKVSKAERPEYDYLHLKNGNVLVGDVGDFALTCRYREQELSLKRELLRRVTREKIGAVEEGVGPVDVRLLHRHQDEYFSDPERVVDFELDEHGTELTGAAEVSNAYLNRGIVFEAENKGYVGISGYPFRVPHLPAENNSICAIDVSGAYMNRFRGMIRISFCEPGLPDSPAGVKEFGLFASRIDNPRDLIMEAYNADSQLLGCVEATDQGTVFLGIKSNEPIAFIRLLTNPYLFEVGRNIDETYVVDHVWFGKPVSLNRPKLANSGNSYNTVVLKSGDLLTVEDVRFGKDSIRVFEPQMKRQIRLAFDDVQSIRLGGRGKPKPSINTNTQLRFPNPTSDQWMAMLPDRSVFNVNPGSKFAVKLFDQELEQSQIAGFWAQRDQIRFPVQRDFSKNKPVLVFPTCRIAADLKISDDLVSWSPKESKIEQPVFSSGATEDVTPQFNQFKFSMRKESQMPTVWLQPPQLVDPASGAVDLVDGQKIMLGTEMGFSIESVNDQSISITGANGWKVDLPMAQVQAIRFPKNK